jgi:GMP synthase-like glutamine amidotransferase
MEAIASLNRGFWRFPMSRSVKKTNRKAARARSSREKAGVVDKATQEAIELAYGEIDSTEDNDIDVTYWARGGLVDTSPKPDKWRVVMIPDTKIEMPQLYLNVFVAGNPTDQAQFAEMFVRTGSKKADSPDEADLVVFTGGEDVNPCYYGEEPHRKTRFDDDRDNYDLELYYKCWSEGIPMFGVCRGMQFIHVMEGGKLYQDVDNHYRRHDIWDVIQQRTIEEVTSVHHQMCIDNRDRGMLLLATANVSTQREYSPTRRDPPGKGMDIEAFFYRESCALGVQGHPEYSGCPIYTKWCLDLINQYVIENIDLDFNENGVRRIKPDIVKQREEELKNKTKENA